MKIFITGGFGKIGKLVLVEAFLRGHTITIFDKYNKKNIKTSKKLKKYYENIVWGDIRDIKELYEAIKDMEMVINLATIIPPKSEKNIREAHDVNVKGLENIINSIIISRKPIKLLHISTLAVMGDTQKNENSIKIDEKYKITNNYSANKIISEKMLDISKVDWCIFRPAIVISSERKKQIGLLDFLKNIPYDSKIETIYISDLIYAIVNAI